MINMLLLKWGYRMLIVVLALQLLSACASTEDHTTTSIPFAPTAPADSIPTLAPTDEVNAQPSFTPTVDHYQEWLDWLATRPRDMESYGKVYDPTATPRLPPPHSVNMFIWGENLPLRVIDHIPEFFDTPPLAVADDLTTALAKAGCASDGWTITCAGDSPWQSFGCGEFSIMNTGDPGLPTGVSVIAGCLTPEVEAEEQSDYLFRRGCAFRKDVAYIIEEPDGYRLIATPGELRELWQPIENAEEALAFAVLMTGLTPTFDFEAQPELLYFKDSIEGTRVLLQDGSYLIKLFHYETCLCEPWVNSEVHLSVSREGEITWLDALPISMTVGIGCAD